MTKPTPAKPAATAKTIPQRLERPNRFYANLYVGFLSVLSVAFAPILLDPVLVPRQLLLTVFLGIVWAKLGSDGALKQGLVPLLKAPMTVAWGAFFLTGVVAMSQSVNLGESLYVLSKYGVEGLFLLTTALLLYTGRLAVQDLMRGVVVFAAVAVGIALFQVLRELGAGEDVLEKAERITSTMANKNLLSGVLLLAAPFVGMAFLDARKAAVKGSLGTLLGLMLVLLWLLQTRSVWAGAGVFLTIGGLSIVLQKRRSRQNLRPLLWVGLGLMFAIGALASVMLSRQEGLWRLRNNYSVQERLQVWNMSKRMAAEHPVLGVGPGNWQIQFPQYGIGRFFFEAINQGERTFQRPHNDYLWVLCEQGAIGLAAWLVFIGLGLRALALAGWAIFAFTDFPLERIEHMVLVMAMLAIGLANSLKPTEPDQPVSRTRQPATPALLVAAALILLSLSAMMGRWQGEAHMRRLLKAKMSGNWEKVISEAEKAKGTFYTVDNTTIPVDWYAGLAWFTMGDFTRAKADFEAANAVHPHHLQTLSNLGSCEEKLGNHAAAARLYRQALTISPRFKDAIMNLAATHFNAGHTDSALSTLRMPGPEHDDPRYRQFVRVILGRKLAEMGKANSSPAELQRIEYLKANPEEAVRLFEERKL